MARQRGLPADLNRWRDQRDAITQQIMERGWHPQRNAFVQHYDTDVLDASVLLMPLTKFIAPRDPRWLSTLDAVGEELVSDSLVYRYNIATGNSTAMPAPRTFTCSLRWRRNSRAPGLPLKRPSIGLVSACSGTHRASCSSA